ncbi:site-specific recombinase, phage integrase family [Bifidobacterium tissieri]|uniref:Site-specific recombinase, phage integrase family n=1 Tax=Bifidobacterium tissieri TaxID=1630162 RepID=A0A261FFG8_9BIFI|nr:site-specific integrase [Bifidobacterium tissieri]OZG57882.1 site-specific recombinase, phage integrase family [Bifidobacterium tissieri]
MPRKKKTSSSRRSFGRIEYRPNSTSPTRVVAAYPTPAAAFARWPGLPKRISRSFPIEQESEAVAWLDGERRRMDAGVWEPPTVREKKAETVGLTFDEYFPDWLEQRRYKGNPLRPGTKYRLRRDYENHIQPALGSTSMSRVTQAMADRFRDGLRADQPAMRRNVMKLLAEILRSAALPGEDGSEPIIPRYPLTRSEATPRREREIIPATPAQVRRIMDMMPDAYRLTVELGCAVELRIGEVCALQRRDIILATRRLHVHRTRTTMDPESTTGSPKTSGSERWEPIPETILPHLQEHLASLPEGDDAWLFPAIRDPSQPVHPNTLRGWYDAARKAAHRPDLRFHDLRHTGLTWLALEGATLRELMDAGGHTSADVALLYQHSMDDRRRDLANKVGERLYEDTTPDGLRARIREINDRIRELEEERDGLRSQLEAISS